MNETTEKNINEALDYIKTSAQKTEDFFSEQTPLYIQELLQWVYYDSIINLVITGILTICFIVSFIRFFIKGVKDEWIEEYIVFLCVVTFTLSFICLSLSVCNVKNVIKVKTSPRVIIIEHISEKLTK